PSRSDRSLHQQSVRTRRAHDEAPPENLRRLPIVRRRDGLRGHPLLFLDRQEAELEHHRRRDQRALKLGEIPTPFVSYPANLGSNSFFPKRARANDLDELLGSFFTCLARFNYCA